ncbi:hypothetical protein [Streptomyces sp. NPDC017890]|uniref:hypothetical protein n=1 Tax=Streptomyces sp. NPDC017890 TaxID=3365015 RepID=UPI00378EC68F
MTTLAALTALTVLTVAACGGPDGTDAVPASSPDRPAASRSAAHSAVAEPEPSASAADGDDVSACSDGNCEVTVSKPVTIRLRGPGGAVTLSVTEVGPNEIAYAVTSGNGQSKGSASGPGQGCLTVIGENGSGNSCGGLSDGRPVAQRDAVVIQVTTGTDGTALLYIRVPFGFHGN